MRDYSLASWMAFWLTGMLLPLSVYAANDDDHHLEVCAPQSSIAAINWNLPIDSPPIADEKVIAFIGSDMRNGGVESVAAGVIEAMRAAGWHLVIFDGKGTELGQATALVKAQLIDADGFILGGVDEKKQREYIKALAAQGKPIVGWHSSESVNLEQDSLLFANITTNAYNVGHMAACYAVNHAKQPVKAIIFTDHDFAIARTKEKAIIDVLEACDQCELLAVENISLSETRTRLSRNIQRVIEENKGEVSHFISINDIYFDFAQAVLEAIDFDTADWPQSISAGDGSQEAYRRIKSRSFQAATVPEPLLLQGWQLVDELNRAFNDHPASKYSAPLIVVDQGNIDLYAKELKVFEPSVDYGAHFKRFWLTK